MRRFLLLIWFAAIFAAGLTFTNCSEPLESTTGPGPNPPPPPVPDTDTLYIYDTIIVNDTLTTIDTVIITDSTGVTDTLYIPDTTFVYDTTIIVDTNYVIDTVTITDTTTIVDTIIITVPDTTGTLCGRLNSSRQEIVWLLQNDNAEYLLEFRALPESTRPVQELTVSIDGSEMLWNLSDALEYTVEYKLNEDAVIIISTGSPQAFGHDIDICLTLTPL